MTQVLVSGLIGLVGGLVMGWLFSAMHGARERAGLLERIAGLEAERRAAEEKMGWMQKAEQELREAFQALAASSLKSNAEAFLTQAREQIDLLLQQLRGDWQVQKEQVANILQPVERGLKSLDEQVRLLENERKEAYGSLTQYLTELSRSQKELRDETSHLRSALTTSSSVRGQWGELQLRRIVELAGLTRHVDFEEQKAGQDGRPDMIVHLPNGGILPVDAKISMQNYLAALESSDEPRREQQLQAHARAMREHVRTLGARKYWEQFPKTPDVVIMFVPNESCLSAAFAQDPQLIEDGLATHVLIATPVTLFGLLKAVAYGWQQHAVAENAQEIAREGRVLYERLAIFMQRMNDLGKKLNSTVEAFNETVGSAEKRLIPCARRFQELGAASKELALPEQLQSRAQLPADTGEEA